MGTLLAKNWGWVLARGVLALLLGLLAFSWPALTFIVVLSLIAAYAIVDGLVALVVGIQRHGEEHWWTLLVEGALGIALGVLILAWPLAGAVFLVYLVAGWFAVTGVLEVMAAVRLRKVIHHEWLLGLSGLVSVVLGGLFFAAPEFGAVSIAVVLGFYGLFFGFLQIALAVRLRRIAEGEEHPPHLIPPAPQPL